VPEFGAGVGCRSSVPELGAGVRCRSWVPEFAAAAGPRHGTSFHPGSPDMVQILPASNAITTTYRGCARAWMLLRGSTNPMPRAPRIYIPDLSVHVHQRGINRSAIVGATRDYERLLSFIAKAATEHGVLVHAFALMKTHYHMIVTPTEDGALAKTMQVIGARYTKYFNRKYGRIGTLWNERYSAHLIDSEHYWYNCFRYVELNPVAAHIVTAPEAYPWSSYRVHASGTAFCEWLTTHRLYSALGATPEGRQAAYRAMCNVPLTDAELALIRCPPPINLLELAAGA
jgi:putative transposase